MCRAAVAHWSTNGADVSYSGATPGEVLVYTMNFDPNWDAKGQRAIDSDHVVAARVDSAEGTVRVRYFPRTLAFGVVVFLLTVAAIAADWGVRRRAGGPRRLKARQVFSVLP